MSVRPEGRRPAAGRPTLTKPENLEESIPMSKTLCTIIAVCSLAVLALAPLDGISLGCDKDKAAKPTQVADAKSECATTRQAYQVTQTSSSCKSRQAAAAAVASRTEADCSTKRTAMLLVRALEKMDACGTKAPGREEVLAAVEVMAASNPNLMESVKLVLASETKTCGTKAVQARAVTVAAGDKACDPAACRAAGAKAVVASEKACDPAACRAVRAKAVVASDQACDPAACPAAIRARAVAALAGDAKSCGTNARFVAFGCEKTDRIARAAARAYLELINELKIINGADGCPAECATKVLAAVLDEQQAERAAAAAPAVDEEAVTVSFGAVGDTAAPKPACSGR